MKCSEAKLLGLAKYVTGKPCKRGHLCERYTKTSHCIECVKIQVTAWKQKNPNKYIASMRNWLDNNRDVHNIRVKRWQKANPEKVKNAATLWVKANPEKVKAKYKRYAKNNPAEYTARAVASVARRAKRTPIWLTIDDKWMMREAYKLAKLRTDMFGFIWEVDHVIPLRGEFVSGLHVPTNLQVIPRAENREKRNYYAV